MAADGLTDSSKNALEHAVDGVRDKGVTVEVGGTALATQPAAGGSAEMIGMGIAAVVLLITFGSLAAAGLPLLIAVVGVGISMAGIIALGRTFGLSLPTGTLASMLGLAVGIDHALLVVSWYREERARGREPREATGLAVGTAGSAVVFAGLTVIIALGGLSVIGVPMLTKTGLCAAGAVATALQEALVPHLIVIAVLALVLLLVVFRSVLVPVKAAFGYLLSVPAPLGAVVAVFQWGWGAELLGVEQTGPIMRLMPIFLVGIVFGLAMDYEVFLVARMREAYVHGDRPAQAVVAGFRHNARVVVAAAVMALLGDKAWWLPRRLDRLLPRVDIEGSGLTAAPADPLSGAVEREPVRT